MPFNYGVRPDMLSFFPLQGSMAVGTLLAEMLDGSRRQSCTVVHLGS